MRSIYFLAFILFLTGCQEISVDDGVVPNEYLSQAKKYEGVYKGSFEKVPGELSIVFEGNKPHVYYKNQQGDDILNSTCDSEIGNLLRINLEEEKFNLKINEQQSYRLSRVDFDFNPNKCWNVVEGRELVISFRERTEGTEIFVSVIKDTKREQVCDGNNCQTNTFVNYLTGVFLKKK